MSRISLGPNWLTDEAFAELRHLLKNKLLGYLKNYLESQLPWFLPAVEENIVQNQNKIYGFIIRTRNDRRRDDSCVVDIVSALDLLMFVDELCTKWMKQKDPSYSWVTPIAFNKIRHSLCLGKKRYLMLFIKNVLPDLQMAIKNCKKPEIQKFVARHGLQSVNQFFEKLVTMDANSCWDIIKQTEAAEDRMSIDSGTDDSLSFHTANESIDWLAPQSIDEIKKILEKQPDLSRYLDYEEPEVAWAVQNQASEEIQEFAGRMAQSRRDLPVVDGLDTFFKVLVKLESKWKQEHSSYAWLTLDAFKEILDSIHDYQNLTEFVVEELPDLSQSIQRQTEEEIPHFIGLLAQNKLWRIKSVKDFLIKLWDWIEENENGHGASIVEVGSSLGWLTSETMEDWADNLDDLGDEADLAELEIVRPDVIAALERKDVLWMRQFVRQLEYWANRRLEDEDSFQRCLSEYLGIERPEDVVDFSPRIVLKCRVNGQELNGLVDSGAISMIGMHHLVQCGIDTNKIDRNIAGVIKGFQEVGGLKVGKVYDIPLEINGVRVPDIHMKVMDPSKLNVFIIGRDYLKVNNVEVFCRERKITIPVTGGVRSFSVDDDNVDT